MDRVLTKADVVAVTGLGLTTLGRLEAAGEFPRRRQISPGRSGWLESEVVDYLRARPVSTLRTRTAAATEAARVARHSPAS